MILMRPEARSSSMAWASSWRTQGLCADCREIIAATAPQWRRRSPKAPPGRASTASTASGAPSARRWLTMEVTRLSSSRVYETSRRFGSGLVIVAAGRVPPRL